MGKIIPVLRAVALVAAGAPLLASAATAKTPKVEICHFGVDKHTGATTMEIIEVSEKAVDKHIANHGDYLVIPEQCDEADNDCNGLVDDGITCVPTEGTCECVDCDSSYKVIRCYLSEEACDDAAKGCVLTCRGFDCDYKFTCSEEPGCATTP